MHCAKFSLAAALCADRRVLAGIHVAASGSASRVCVSAGFVRDTVAATKSRLSADVRSPP